MWGFDEINCFCPSPTWGFDEINCFCQSPMWGFGEINFRTQVVGVLYCASLRPEWRRRGLRYTRNDLISEKWKVFFSRLTFHRHFTNISFCRWSEKAGKLRYRKGIAPLFRWVLITFLREQDF
jgi:hypothetical protein